VISDVSKRVALERPERELDDGGGVTITWTQVAVVWASIRSAATSESAAGDDLTARTAHELRLRWRDDVRPGWRVIHESRALRIRSAIDRDGAKRWLHLDCEEELR
jgi:SPP1 family predicted phage head-tail adaptor